MSIEDIKKRNSRIAEAKTGSGPAGRCGLMSGNPCLGDECEIWDIMAGSCSIRAIAEELHIRSWIKDQENADVSGTEE